MHDVVQFLYTENYTIYVSLHNVSYETHLH